MSMRTLERAILEELKKVTGNNKLKMENIMGWSTGPVKTQEGETSVRLPELQVNVAYKI